MLAYLLTHLREGVVFSDQVLIMIVGIAILAFLGFLDDYIKVRRARNRGIFWKTKGWLVLGVSAAIALVARLGDQRQDAPCRSPAGTTQGGSCPCGSG